MRKLRSQLKLGLAAIVGVVLMMVLFPATALAADNRQGQTVTVGPNEIVNDDLYVAASTVDIQGTINGNLIAVGTTITVSGTVTRDVMAMGNSISIPGQVQGSARLAGGQITVAGKISGDLVVAANTVSLTSAALVGRDAMVAGNTVTLAGPITRNLQVAGTDVVLSGPIGGDVTAWDTNLKLESGAAISGHLDYTSNQVLSQATGAAVAGYTHRSIPTSYAGGIAFGVINWLQTLVGLFILGVLLVLLAPGFDGKALLASRTAPWSRLGLGFAIAILVPVVGVMAFVIGLFIGGWWLAIFLFGIYALALTAAFVLTAQVMGRWALERFGSPNAHPFFALLLGLPVLMVVSTIPVLGWIAGMLAVIYGLGIEAFALPWGNRPPAPTTKSSETPVMPTAGVMRPTPSAG